MPTVWMRAGRQHRRKFHRTPDCVQLQKDPARGSSRELLELELSELTHPTPCKFCYPDAPRATSFHRRCRECNTTWPCPHNGGVLVFIPYTHKKRTLFNEPGDVTPRAKYVWPEHVHWYVDLAA